jgi:hypothetical protein
MCTVSGASTAGLVATAVNLFSWGGGGVTLSGGGGGGVTAIGDGSSGGGGGLNNEGFLNNSLVYVFVETSAGVIMCTQFTRFPGTKVQMLTPEELSAANLRHADAAGVVVCC